MDFDVLLILLACLFFTVIPGIFVLRYLRRRGPNLRSRLLAAAQEKNIQHPSRSFPVKNAVGRTGRLGIGTGVLLLSGLGLLAAGILWQADEIDRAELLKNEGVKTTATVVDMTVESDSDSGDTYYVSYTFTSQAADRTTHLTTRREEVSEELYYATEEGQKISIIFAPSRPDVSRILDQYQVGAVNWIAFPIVGGIGLIDLLIAGGVFVQLRRARRLDEEGQIVSVKLLDIYSDSDSDSTTRYVAYQLPGGQPFRHSVSSKVYRSLAAGSHVTVRYLPDNPAIFRLE